jgi:outer membrane murein-binding lipoprotein Lpp
MVSKKLSIAVIVCLALLLGAVGAYGYIENSTLRSRVDSLHEDISTLETYVSSLENDTNRLQSEVSTLEDQVNVLQNTIAYKDSIKTFNYYWEGSIAEYFNVTRFWMNVTFERYEREGMRCLNITVEVNDLRESGASYVGISSDLTSFLDYKTWIFHSFYSWIPSINDTGLPRQPGSLAEDTSGLRFINPVVAHYFPSFHQVRHDTQLGYTYVIPINFEELEINNDRIHVEYAQKVAVEFSFGMELIA